MFTLVEVDSLFDLETVIQIAISLFLLYVPIHSS